MPVDGDEELQPAPAAHPPAKLFAGPPLDYCFKGLGCFSDALYELPESGCPRSAPLVHIDPENPDEVPPAPPLPPRPKSQYNSIAVRFGSNKIHSMEGFNELLVHALDDPQQLRWLDLSCNGLTSIDASLADYPNLQVIYLHGNNISKLSDVKKLAALPNLTKITLHGNPIAELAVYRLYIPAHIPALKSLDFGSITKVDRDKIDTWHKGHVKRIEER